MLPDQMTADRWPTLIFVARAAAEGGVARRGFRAVENAGQSVIFCSRDPIRIVV